MYKNDGKSVCQHIPFPYGQHGVLSTKDNYQISSKITNFVYKISSRNDMPCHNEGYPLLLDCFITILRCIRMIGRVSASIERSLMANKVSLLQKTTLKFQAKWSILAPDQTKKCEPLSYWQISIAAWLFHNHPYIYIRMIGRVPTSISGSSLVSTVCPFF